MRYSRDMTGYGENAPDPKWPGGAKIAVQIVVNYEEGGENSIEHGDAASEAFLSEIVGAQPWPGKRHWNMETIYDYGARAGFWRLYRLLKGIPVTVYGVATALARSPEQVAAMQRADWEIATHGLKWIEYKDVDREVEADHIAQAVALHKLVTGERPYGFYQGRASMNTIPLGCEEGGFEYLADSYADELPFWMEHQGKPQLVVPYTLDANDMRFANGGFTNGEEFFLYLKDAFDNLYREGQQGTAKMLSIGLHCRLAGRPARAEGFRRFLEYAKSHEGVWFATRLDIARHWKANFPWQAVERPSAMDRDTFVSRFGSIYEHSAWIAERCWDGEMGPSCDRPVGLAAALARVFRASSDEERLGVLLAHPDLAGKLAAAKRLTAESTAEQASAGLDALTDEERAEFDRLNTTYVEKHQFPFIIAVRDHDKASIMEAMRRRIDNDTVTERSEAERQVCRIGELRLQQMLGQN